MSRSRDPHDTRDGDGGFLSRWSQRKQAARNLPSGSADTPVEAQTPAVDEAAARRAEEHERQLAENRAAAEAVDLETLDFGSDYSVFLKEGVSTQLKNAALRKLWSSNPVLACVDGLNDYDDDFRTMASVAEEFRSSWQVGKGYGWMREEAEAEEALRAAETSGEADAVEPEEGREKDVAHADVSDGSEPVADSDTVRATAQADDPGSASDTIHDGQAGAEADGTGPEAAGGLPLPRASDPAPVPVRPARRRVRFT